MNKPIVFLFSGQGSQYFNMGKELYVSNSMFRKWMQKLDEVFLDLTGVSVLNKLYDDSRKKSELFDHLFYTHPSIFMVEYSLAQVLLEKGIYPDYVIGSSMGEFAACAIAGVMSCEDAFHSLVAQAQMVENLCPKGGMLAIIHDHKLYSEVPALHKNAELASINFHSHFVVSGSLQGIMDIEKYLKEEEIIYQRLPVSFAFHSSLLDPAAQPYIQFLQRKTMNSPELIYLSSLIGKRVSSFPDTYFWDVIRQPIDFRGAISCIDQEKEPVYIDLGPSGTLANFAKYNLGKESAPRIFSIVTPFGNDMKSLELLGSYIATNLTPRL